jgi:hypothetical protein
MHLFCTLAYIYHVGDSDKRDTIEDAADCNTADPNLSFDDLTTISISTVVHAGLCRYKQGPILVRSDICGCSVLAASSGDRVLDALLRTTILVHCRKLPCRSGACHDAHYMIQSCRRSAR